MRILLLTRYERMGSSSRLRTLQFLPYLRSVGIEVTVAPLLRNEYLDQLYRRRKRKARYILTSYVTRIFHLLKSAHYDLIWLEGELFPWLPSWGEILLTRLGVRYVVDYDDALFHKYDQHPNPVIRKMLGSKINEVMRHATVVIVGNSYLATRAKEAGAVRVAELPTVVDVSRYKKAIDDHRSRFTIGWIGSPMTSKYLKIVHPVLSRICRNNRACLLCIGSGPVEMSDVPHTVVTWSEETEASALSQLDVGIMPLPDAPWERGKCGLKIIQYMAARLPVIASPIGSATKIVERGVTGYLASTLQEWMVALEKLRQNIVLRKRMGEAGHRVVQEKYSLEKTAPQLTALLHEACVKAV